MPPCNCIALPASSTAAAHAYDLAIDAATDESVPVGPLAWTARASTTASRRAARHRLRTIMSAHACLTAWNEPMGAAELVAHLHVRRPWQPASPSATPRLSHATAMAARSRSALHRPPVGPIELPHRPSGTATPSAEPLPDERVSSTTGCAVTVSSDGGDYERRLPVSRFVATTSNRSAATASRHELRRVRQPARAAQP